MIYILVRLHALLERVSVPCHCRHVLFSVLDVLRFQVGIWIFPLCWRALHRLIVGTHLVLLAVIDCIYICVIIGVRILLQFDFLVLAIEVDGAHLRERARLARFPRVLKSILNFFFSSISLCHRQRLQGSLRLIECLIRIYVSPITFHVRRRLCVYGHRVLLGLGFQLRYARPLRRLCSLKLLLQ